jgi:glycosyltransferase involved in cell wall biosynthesis
MDDRVMKIIYVVNEGRFFLSHRLALAVEAKRHEVEVVVVCGANTGEQGLADAGLRYVTVPMSRSGFNPFKELRTAAALLRIYRAEKPDLVHHVTIKPVLYGTSMARWSGVPAVVNAVPGMGFVFTRRGLLARIRRSVVQLLYRLCMFHPNMRVIFQNNEDMQAFTQRGIVDRQHVALIRGSGVDLDVFRCAPEPPGPVTFVLVGRMLRHKGVYEYVEAARRVRQRRPDWRFQLVGDVDPGNPASLRPDELIAWQQAGEIEWLGQRRDVPEVLAAAHVVCLPSYREGLPKTLLEAAACGRAMIASDIAGCREVVRPNVTGLLVPPRVSEPLADAMLRLGEDDALRHRFARAARSAAEEVFSLEDVVRHTFRVYDELLLP